jgi:L-galactose dehydrogenase
MQFRQLGNTGLNVSVLSYGASSLGGVFHDVDETDGIRTVHEALDRGVNFIDVAPYYGLTKAETVLGRALRTVKRDRYFLATKVGRYGAADFDFSPQRVTRSVDESLARLGVDHVDILQCHDIEFGDLRQIVAETLPALRKVAAAGKARFIGITGLPLTIFQRVIEATDVDTVLSYCRYALNDTSLAGLLPYLRNKGIGVINASPLAMGLLSERGAPAWHPAPREIRDACSAAARLCRDRGTDIARLAIQFAVAEPGIATTLVGTASPENMRNNIAWADEPIDRDLLAAVQNVLAPVKDQTWPSGRPENNEPVDGRADVSPARG